MSAQNVRVFCRFRPMNAREAEEKSHVKFVSPTSLQVPSGAKEPHTFMFDRVFPPTSTQEETFSHTAEPLVSELMSGYNCTVFAYGQTGSGKTHTMMGQTDPALRGVIPRLVWAVFQAIEDADTQLEFIVKLSYVEIYNEKVKDLLDPKMEALKIRESPEGVYIQGVAENYVSSYEQVLHLMEAGQSLRAVSATNMNSQSSRSHSVFIFTLAQKNKTTGSVKASKLTLVDLAGSEKVRKTGATGQTMVEAQNINKSLAALGNVINALTSGNAAHVPYRDSKLTRLLSDSLGGNSKTVLIITASPADSESEETLSTCRFGLRAKSIKNNAKVNEDRSAAEYKRLWETALESVNAQALTIAQLQQSCISLRECLVKNNIPLPSDLDNLNLGKNLLASQIDTSLMDGSATVNIVDDRRTFSVVTQTSPNVSPKNSPHKASEQAITSGSKKEEVSALSFTELERSEKPTDQNQNVKILLSPLSSDMRKPPPPPPSAPRVPSNRTPSKTNDKNDDQFSKASEQDGSELEPKRLMMGEQANEHKLAAEPDSLGSSLERIKELEAKLQTSDELCKTLLESSLYWRQQRLAQEKSLRSQAPTSTKIAVVLSGGGGANRARNKVAALSPFSVAQIEAQSSRPRSPAARNRSPTSRRSAPPA